MSILIPLSYYTPSSSCVFYTLSLHDALPICPEISSLKIDGRRAQAYILNHIHRQAVTNRQICKTKVICIIKERSEEHTSELQSRGQHVCRLLLEKKTSKDAKEVEEIEQSRDS